MAEQSGTLLLALAGGLGLGAAIVFAGVWLAANWRALGAISKSILLILLAAAYGGAWHGLSEAMAAKIALTIETGSAVFFAGSLLLGLYKIWRETWSGRPAVWHIWLLRELVRVLFWPMGLFMTAAAALSTIALFTTIQQGPQTELLLFELGLFTAACWAIVMVGGVWARVHMPDRR